MGRRPRVFLTNVGFTTVSTGWKQLGARFVPQIIERLVSLPLCCYSPLCRLVWDGADSYAFYSTTGSFPSLELLAFHAPHEPFSAMPLPFFFFLILVLILFLIGWSKSASPPPPQERSRDLNFSFLAEKKTFSPTGGAGGREEESGAERLPLGMRRRGALRGPPWQGSIRPGTELPRPAPHYLAVHSASP